MIHIEKEEKEETENQKQLNMDPEKLGERNILPVLDPIRFRLLNKVKDKFQMKFEKKIPFSYVCEGLVDNKEVIVAFIDQSEGTPVHLPAEFEGFPVLISYEALELLYHC